MTEKKKRRTQADRNYEAVQSFKSEICFWVGRHYPDMGRTHEEILEWRNTNVLNNPRHHKLSIADKESVRAIWTHVMEVQWHTLVWTHVLDGVRHQSGAPELEGFYGKMYEQEQAIGYSESYHCYAFVVGDRVIWLPYSQLDRERELASGRLTQDDIDLIRTSKAKRLKCGSLPNGRPGLQVITLVATKNGRIVPME